MKFAKPALSIDQQIALLERRGMTIPDRAKAARNLQHMSYYRLRAYWLPFEQPAPDADDHMFRAGTTFDAVVELYVFDRLLRLLVMDAIERFEVSLRGCWAHHLAMKYGSHGYLDQKLYSNTKHHAQALLHLASDVDRSTDTFIEHYKHKFDGPELPPIWMTSEVISLGKLSKWLENLKLTADRQAIAKHYHLDESVLCSTARHLAYIRNICAHHGRLWNKQFVVTMKVPRSPVALKLAMSDQATRRLYNTLVALGYFLRIVSPGSDWRSRLVDLLGGCSIATPSVMGFPADWRTRPFWTTP